VQHYPGYSGTKISKEWQVPKRAIFPWGGVAVVLWLLVAAAPALAQELAGRVVSVHDGDTVNVLDAGKVQYKIRLAGIDAPELHQAFGRVSQRHLSAAIQCKNVVVHWTKHDKYGRIVGTILLDDHDVNLDQVRAGLAWHYKRYEREQPPAERVTYANAETEAHVAHLGLWQEASPMPPWEYRKTKKADSTVPKTIN